LRFLKSFRYAIRGIVYCINNERNMRFHTVAAVYVLAFSPFFPLSREDYAILFLTIAAVMTAEMFNTVAEELCDLDAASFHPVVRIVKDMAAGAVLITAAFSVAVGIALFWKPAVLAEIVHYFFVRPPMILLLLATIAASVLYIAVGPTSLRDFIRGKIAGLNGRTHGK
jgi:diacylglycerol kinase (ATP)